MRTCNPSVPSFVSHSVPIPACCPVSGNPKAGSTIRVSYLPRGIVVPVETLEERVRGYVGGFESIRGMEEMIQDIALWCAEVTGVRVRAVADLIIQPPYGGELQTMRVSARSESAALALQLEAMKREMAELRKTVADCSDALSPFADSVFNDNGDMTVTLGGATGDDYVRAYFADHRARTLIQGEKP